MALDRRELLLLVDAGASHTRAVVATPSGNVLGLGEAGGGNPFASGGRAAGAHLLRALRRALADARRPPSSISLAAVGSAGVGCDGTGR